MTDSKQETGQAREAGPPSQPGSLPEPWLRGTHTEFLPVTRALLHSLEMAREDIERWCGCLNDAELFAQPFGLPAPAFQLRHIAGSLDRFMTYAEGRSLTPVQLAALAAESDLSAGREEAAGREEVMRGFAEALDRAQRWLGSREEWQLAAPLKIGRKGLPTTLGGLLVHMAEHTQRHVGQAITTAKVVMAQRS